MLHTVKPLGFGEELHCMIPALTPFLRCVFLQPLGEQKSGRKLREIILNYFERLNFWRNVIGEKFQFPQSWNWHMAGSWHRPLGNIPFTPGGFSACLSPSHWNIMAAEGRYSVCILILVAASNLIWRECENERSQALSSAGGQYG